MEKTLLPQPTKAIATQLRPTCFADQAGRIYAQSVADEHKKHYGQYLTPVPVADFMADFVQASEREEAAILDPGLGTSILACALAEALVKKNKNLKKIKIVGYEIDEKMLQVSNQCLNYLKRWLKDLGVGLEYEIRGNDFILDNRAVLQNSEDLFAVSRNGFEKFDYVISNPPYFKLSKDDPRAQAAAVVVHGQPNIYSLFMIASAYLLQEDGQLIFITPRSYTAGPYFRLFREKFLASITPLAFHLFDSRKEAFERDFILQENLIVHAKRKATSHDKGLKVFISCSQSSKDLGFARQLKVHLEKVVDYQSFNKIIFLPTTQEEKAIIAQVKSWEGSLAKFGLKISTGPVVPFRAEEYITETGELDQTHAPLLWMNNMRDMQVHWPLKVRNKQQYIKISRESAPLLLPNRNYVLLRRFSAKEEKRRLNSAVYLKSMIPSESIGLENHINYIYRAKGELTREEVFGLAAVLNSLCLDVYFRASNGNTQVSATEIRELPLPAFEEIRMIGKH